MALGPVELTIIKFPDHQFKGEIVSSLKNLVENHIIRIIDIVFIHKDKDGNLVVLEIDSVEDEFFALFEPLVLEVTGLITEDDIQQFAAAISNDTSTVLMLFEHTWAITLKTAVADAKGQVILSERIPKAVIETLTMAAAS